MPFVGGTLFDPAPQQVHLGVGEARLLRLRRRHHLVRIMGENALEQLAGVGFARVDCGVASQVRQGALAKIEAQLALAILFIRPVAGEAVVGKNRPDVLVEADAFGQRGRRADSQRGQQNESKVAAKHVANSGSGDLLETLADRSGREKPEIMPDPDYDRKMSDRKMDMFLSPIFLSISGSGFRGRTVPDAFESAAVRRNSCVLKRDLW